MSSVSLPDTRSIYNNQLYTCNELSKNEIKIIPFSTTSKKNKTNLTRDTRFVHWKVQNSVDRH